MACWENTDRRMRALKVDVIIHWLEGLGVKVSWLLYDIPRVCMGGTAFDSAGSPVTPWPLGVPFIHSPLSLFIPARFIDQNACCSGRYVCGKLTEYATDTL